VKVASAGTTLWYTHGIRQPGGDGDDGGTSDAVALVGASSGKGRGLANGTALEIPIDEGAEEDRRKKRFACPKLLRVVGANPKKG